MVFIFEADANSALEQDTEHVNDGCVDGSDPLIVCSTFKFHIYNSLSFISSIVFSYC